MTAAEETYTEREQLAMSSAKEWRDKYYESRDVVDVAEAEAERLRTENRTLRLRLDGPTNEKADGLARAAHEALTAFYAAIKDSRDQAAREYPDVAVYRGLVQAAGAVMHLPAELRPNLDALGPAIDGLYALAELGYMSSRYGDPREDIERFLALEIVRRTVGLPSKAKTKAPSVPEDGDGGAPF